MYIYTTDDKKEFEYAFHGIDFLLCLWDMDQWLRSEIKYSQRVSASQRSAVGDHAAPWG